MAERVFKTATITESDDARLRAIAPSYLRSDKDLSKRVAWAIHELERLISAGRSSGTKPEAAKAKAV